MAKHDMTVLSGHQLLSSADHQVVTDQLQALKAETTGFMTAMERLCLARERGG